MLAEASTTKISEKQKPKTFYESKKVAKKWWIVAKKAKLELEKNIWEEIVSERNNLDFSKKLNLK
jgi:hypothetical protein